MGKRILQLTEAELAEIQASGFLPVSVPSETFRLAINHLLANWKPWATEPTKGSLEISTTQYPATIPVKIGGTICGYLVPAPPTNETGVVLSWVDEETGFAWREEVISSTQIKDNAFDSGDDITEVQELTFFRNQDSGANYPILSSEERPYGILLPAPQLEADQGKVPMYKVGDKIKWEHLQTGVTTTVSEITENTTVTLVAGQNRYLTCTNTPAISVEIADNNAYHIQINGSCTLALTGVEWWGDAITTVAAKAEISVMNNVAIGVLYD